MLYVFPKMARVSASDSKLCSIGAIPELDAAGIDYRAELIVHTADPALERRIGHELTCMINARADVLQALRQARKILDSVAFVSTEGDTTAPIKAIDRALARMRQA